MLYENQGDSTPSSMMITRVEPVWFEPELASQFTFCTKDSTCPVSPTHQKNIYNSTLKESRHVHKLFQLVDQFLPNTDGAIEAKLPSSITFDIVGPSTKYLWVRTLAWRIQGQITYGFKKATYIQRHKAN
ncbi:hypothetical protein DSO57_1026322 [Entomophthora muscae]|uniref:Uncharacterized protein n=1 Tax=Entomophthora muscae TaxID=34485 RepID=A0ACC2UBJ5_9FUNG|nr:hypothetical protein DSO57_1026322 [Entomophthora muscae]